MAEVFIGVGSNIGDREDYIQRSINMLGNFGIEVVKISSIIETPPYGYRNQPNFLNCAVKARTFFSPLHLLNVLLKIEERLGRQRTLKWGPRTIDLDILFYNSIVVDTPYLKIPHPDMRNRYFVLKPLSELEPDYVHPVYGKTVSEMLRELLSVKI